MTITAVPWGETNQSVEQIDKKQFQDLIEPHRKYAIRKTKKT